MPSRKGSFGRRNRFRTSSLSALVAQLRREQQAAEDRAVFDAYENGGRYKGQKVTDQFILDYIGKRRDGFDRQDPLWDEWNNRLTQTKFRIGEEKIGLAFQQGKVGAGAVAAFYRNELKGIPRDSAFYREVAGRAAQWAKSAAGAARGRARGRATASGRKKLNAELQSQQGYLALERALTEYARREGIIGENQKLQEADATELMDMFDRGITVDGEALTLVQFRQAAKAHLKSIDREVGYQIALGNQGVTAMNKRTKFLQETVMGLNVVDDRAKYELARENLASALALADEDPTAAAEAFKAYASQLETIAKNALGASPENENSSAFIGALKNELDFLATGQKKGDMVSDIWDNFVDPLWDPSSSGNPSDQYVTQYNRMLSDANLLATGQAYFGQDEPGGPMKVVKWPPGGPQSLGLDDSLQPSVQTIGGVKRTVYLKGAEVKASAITDASGEIVDTSAPDFDQAELRRGLLTGDYIIREGKSVGYTFTDASGDVKYGVRDPLTGTMFFTDENPWTSDPVNLGSGLTVLATAVTGTGDRAVPDLTKVFRDPTQPLANTGSPVLSDTPLTLKELNSLASSGQIRLLDSELEEYRQRLAREQAAIRSAQQGKDRYWDDHTGTPGGGTDFAGGVAKDTRSIAARMREGMDEVSQTINVLLNAGGDRDDRIPSLGQPPALKPPPPPPTVPKTVTPKPAPPAPSVSPFPGKEEDDKYVPPPPPVIGGGGGGKKRA